MSREIPLLASEKIKLGCLTVFILMLLIPGLLGGYKKIYRLIVRDKSGYEKTMKDLCDYYHIEVVDSDADIADYDIGVDFQTWNAYSEDQRFAYCGKIFNSINETLQKYKMVDKDAEPIIDFYINSRRVAYISGGYTHILE